MTEIKAEMQATAGGKLLLTVRDHPYSRGVCFLCGEILSEANRSDEHVFPRWVQRRFDLRDRTIGLLNRVRIAYRKLTIPCCTSCNNGPLSDLERRAKRWLETPVASLTPNQEQDLFLWASKILFGLLYRQLFTAVDPRNRDGGPIFLPEQLRQFDQMHRLLQGIRSSLTYRGLTPLPGSFAVFEVQCPPAVSAQFDWQDNPLTETLYVRLGDRAILLSHDGGAQLIAVGDIIRRHQRRKLHPLQMEELAAKFLYKEATLVRWPVFSFADDGHLFVAFLAFSYPEAPAIIISSEANDGTEGGPAEIVTMALPHPKDDGRPLFGEWVREEYFQVLSRSTGLAIDMLGGADGTTATWLVTLDDQDLVFTLEDQPYPL